jgi:AraC family transcriptional regulator
MLDRELSAAQLRSMLEEKQVELAQRVQAEQRRLEMVAVRLGEIEAEGRRLLPDAVLKSSPKLRVACRQTVAPSVERVTDQSDRLYQAIIGWLALANLRPSGEWFALHDNPEYRERAVPIEAAVVIEPYEPEPRSLPAGDATLRWLPAVPEMASVVVARQPVGLQHAYLGLYGWVEANGYLVNGPVREVYLQEPGEHTAEMIELQFPIERNRHWSIHYNASHHTKETEMDVKIITQPALTLVGMRYQGKNANNEIAAMWDVFNTRYAEIANVIKGACYGVCRVPPGLPEGEFEYVACAPVSKVENLPEGMLVVELPALKCAAYPHHGKLDKLGETYQALYQGWLPQSGYEVVEPGFDMEYYGKEFDFTDSSVLYIYLPIK